MTNIQTMDRLKLRIRKSSIADDSTGSAVMTLGVLSTVARSNGGTGDRWKRSIDSVSRVVNGHQWTIDDTKGHRLRKHGASAVVSVVQRQRKTRLDDG